MKAAIHRRVTGFIAIMLLSGGFVVLNPISATAAGELIVPTTGPVTGQYAPKHCDGSGSFQHTGIDIAASTGSTIVAAASGTVALSDTGTAAFGKSVVVTHGNGYSTLYGHMNSFAVSPDQRVEQGQVLGTVGNTGASRGPHVHFELRLNGKAQSSMNDYFPCGRNVTRGSAISGSFPGFVSATLPARYGALGLDGQLIVKEGNPLTSWVNQQLGTLVDFSMSQNRIGVVSATGEALVKEGTLYSNWVSVMPSGIRQIVVDGSRIAVVSTDNILYVKDGTISADWVVQLSNVRKVAVSGTRIAIVSTDNKFFVKEGTILAPWNEIGAGTDIALSGNRIGVVSGGAALVKEGALSSNWLTVMPSGIGSILLNGTRVGVIATGSATLYVKEGNLSQGWTTQFQGVSSASLSGNKIGIVSNGTALVKEGTLSDGWTQLVSGIKQVGVAN